MVRKTPQMQLVIQLLQQKGHATNHELAVEVRKLLPDVADTTIHRITTRLVNARLASYAPSLNMVKVLDTNTELHDHFLCQSCRTLVDIKISDNDLASLDDQLPGKLVKKNILIAGICSDCVK